MKIFLDDVRNPPAEFDGVLCRTAAEAITHIEAGNVTWISFDHDLGEDAVGEPMPSGYDVAKRVEELVASGSIPMPEWHVHSANPVGRNNITAAMVSAERFAPAKAKKHR